MGLISFLWHVIMHIATGAWGGTDGDAIMRRHHGDMRNVKVRWL